MIPRVQLGESAVTALLNNQAAVTEFPWLREIPKIKKAGCGGCGSKMRMGLDTNWVKIRVANLGKKEKRRIRELLNAKQVVGTYRENGQVRSFAF